MTITAAAQLFGMPVLIVVGSGGREGAVSEHVVVRVGGGVGAVVGAAEPVGSRGPGTANIV